MDISSGIVLHRKREGSEEIEFFLCTPGGPYWSKRKCWSFPKGIMEPEENPFEAAIREFREETGAQLLDLCRENYRYYGAIQQRTNKRVHVWSKSYGGEDLNNPNSNTFTWIDGKEYPEIGEYAWKTLKELVSEGNFVKAYIPIYRQIEEEYH